MNQHSPAFAPESTGIDASSVMANPHASFVDLCAEHVVARFGSGDMVLRAMDVLGLFTGPRTTQVEVVDYARVQRQPDGAVKRSVHDLLLFRSGCQHCAKRGLFARNFTYSTLRDSGTRPRGGRLDRHPSIRQIAPMIEHIA